MVNATEIAMQFPHTVLSNSSIGCSICGRGNRSGAKFCRGCGECLGRSWSKECAEGALTAPLHCTIAVRTDRGRLRVNNQDTVYVGDLALPDGKTAHLCMVADGMGGAQAGEQASRIAVDVTRAEIQAVVTRQPPVDDEAWTQLLRHAILIANRQVYAASRSEDRLRGMGTTLTVALIVGNHVHLASVGDSRAYRIRADGVTMQEFSAIQLTSDHSLVARLVSTGQMTLEEARFHPQRNVLYRAIGTDPSVIVDTRSELFVPGDRLLLCSDGLVIHVRDEELARIALEQLDVHCTCEQLVSLANTRGGEDNISVILTRMERN